MEIGDDVLDEAHHDGELTPLLENIRPKSIVREMFENFRSFSDYIGDYELQRAEGILLRHIHSVYKVLVRRQASCNIAIQYTPSSWFMSFLRHTAGR